MTPATTMEARSAGPAVHAALAAIDEALAKEEGAITASTETRLQTALYLLRKEGGRAALLSELEGMAASLRIMIEAKRTNQPNLDASRRARLRRLRAASPLM
ncbi:MAG TPA: hypothetical protein VEZ20_11445 [Allosphingosinicella sp.]|jgi:hypothetical protein|nr:hypothetical protein [Allosphingosinicella sp.]